MRGLITVAFASLLVAACSGGIGSYEEGVEASAEVMQEMMGVLEGVTDEASAKNAAGKIESLGNRLGEISKQMAELPRPSASEMQAIAKKQMAEMRSFQQDASVQMMKMMQYPVLQEAWMRAMENMQ